MVSSNRIESIMRVGLVSLFPEFFGAFSRASLVGKAIQSGILELVVEDLREHGVGKHRNVDDAPYGGGSGMVMRVDCVVAALEAVSTKLSSPERPHVILMSPQGRRFEQADATRLAQLSSLVIICGRYEGYDERVRDFVDEEVSLGDFILCGGEVAAQAVIEATVRLLPGVLGNTESLRSETFSDACEGGLEYPQYTRPAEFRGRSVPEVLLSGDHSRIESWRHQESALRTRRRRPDLWERE